MEHGKPLTFAQYFEIVEKIGKDKHGFYDGCTPDRHPYCKYIKYIYPCFDTRSGEVFRVSFDDVVFDHRNDPTPMYDRIISWLDAPKARRPIFEPDSSLEKIERAAEHLRTVLKVEHLRPSDEAVIATCRSIEAVIPDVLRRREILDNQATDTLMALVMLKSYKDECGKDDTYEELMPRLWERARKALQLLAEKSRK